MPHSDVTFKHCAIHKSPVLCSKGMKNKQKDLIKVILGSSLQEIFIRASCHEGL